MNTLRKISNIISQDIKSKLIYRLIKDPGCCSLFGKKFHYHYRAAFNVTYEEIFNKGIYTFEPTCENPQIIDCGSNMGLSLLFFSQKYPNSHIIAFEPDSSVLQCLEKNIQTYGMYNVELNKKAVWIRNKTLEFFTDKGMGGRLGLDYQGQTPVRVEAIRLKDFIANKKIDLLKIDIEGAEFDVIVDCEPELICVEKIFIEYHSINDEDQKLGELLNILKRNGFRYHLSQSFSRNKPFIDEVITCEKIDMAVNVFAYRQ